MNSLTMSHVLRLSALGAALLMPGLVFAINDICGVVYVFNSIAQWFGIFVFIVSIMAFLYAALLYLTNAGNEEKLTTARQVLIYAVIGTAIALLATNAVGIIKATVGGDAFNVSQCSSFFPGSQNNLPPS